MIADTRDQVATLNAAIRARRIADGELDPDGPTTTTLAGQTIGVGDQISTRRNDAELGVANRETWTVTHVHDDGALEVATADRRRTLPRDYALTSTELAYASTAYGAQGQTVDTAHVVVSDHSGAAATYVGMSRGRGRNVAHLVADTVADARDQWTSAFARDRADLGPARARLRALDDIERYGIAPAARRPRLNVGSDAPQPIDVARQVTRVAHEISTKVRLEQDTTGPQVLLFLMTAHSPVRLDGNNVHDSPPVHDRRPIHNKESTMSMAHDPDDTLLTIKEVAAIVRAPEGTVRYWRFMGTGPRSIKVGKRVCFWKSDVLQWLEDLGG